MSRIRSSGTEFEKRIFRELRKRKIYFQSNYSKTVGKPDIALPAKKKAVFLHSDFWHGWQLPRWENILPSQFWKEKLCQNRIRDRKNNAVLRRSGWIVLVVWEHQLRNDFDGMLMKIIRFLK